MTPLLEVRDLCAYYGASQALHGIDFEIRPGGITALLGANGAGKTTTLRAICNMVRTTGEVRFEGNAIARRATESIVRLGVAHVPEGRGTFTDLSVEENLRIAGYTRRDKAGVKADLDLVLGYFPRLKERLAQQAGTLSGGEQQMLAIGRALMAGPKLLALDEPSLGLAPLIVDRIYEVVAELCREMGVTILLVEQHAARALEIADYAYVLENGWVVLDGPAAKLARNEDVQEFYLGAAGGAGTRKSMRDVKHYKRRKRWLS